MLRLNLLGGFSAKCDEAGPVRVASTKGVALLAYLALSSPRAQTRDRLIDLLWTEQTRERGRNNLRQTTARLRRAFASIPDFLVVTGDTVSLNDAQVSSDVTDFLNLSQSTELPERIRALDVYSGDFLAGFHIDSYAFDEWILLERQRLTDTAASVARELLSNFSKAGDIQRAIMAVSKLIKLDAFQEFAHRALMKLYAEDGRREAALAHFERYRRLLKTELGVEPEPEIRTLRDQIEAGTFKSGSEQASNEREALAQAVNALRSASERAHRRGSHGEVITLLESLRSVLELSGQQNTDDQLEVRWWISRAHYARNSLDTALMELRALADAAEQRGNRQWLLRALTEQAQVLRLLGNLIEATKIARRAAVLSQEEEDYSLEIRAQLRLAAMNFASGNYGRALGNLSLNEDTVEEIIGREQSGLELNSLAVRHKSWLAWTCAELGRFDEGIHHGTIGLKLADEADETYGRVHIRTALGVLYFRQQNYPAAIGTLEGARELIRHSDLPLFHEYIVPVLSCSYAEAGRHDEARMLLLDFGSKSSSSITIATAAEANRIIGRIEAARSQAERALQKAVDGGFRGDEGWIRRTFGLTNADLGDSKAARTLLTEALDIAEMQGMRPLAERCRHELESLN